MAPKRKTGAGKGAGKITNEVVKENKVSEEAVVEEEAPTACTEGGVDGEEDKEERQDAKKAKAENTQNGAKRARKAKGNSKKKGVAAPKEKVVQPEQAETVSAPLLKAAEVSKVITIEASKECNSIKTRAAKVQAGLKDSLPGLEVLVNPDKPRKGCFEIRDGEGNLYLSLLEMPRPYTNLKSLNLDKTVEEIVAKIK